MRFLILFCLFTTILFSCNHKNEKKVQKEMVSKKKKKKSLKKKQDIKIAKSKELDTINKKNSIAFLTAYGKQHPETVVKIKTRLGNIKIKLYKDTPLHRANFIFLTKTGYFNTTCFHRVVSGFIVQGGSSDNPFTQKARNKYQNYTLPAEILPHRKHKYGALAAAREWDDNPKKRSSAFEFYIIQSKRGSHHLDGEHTIFGEITEGFSTIDKIAKLEVDIKEWPIRDVFIEAIVLK